MDKPLPPEAWRRILLVQTAEELDAECRHLKREDRNAAGAGVAGTLDDAQYLRIRADILYPLLPPLAVSKAMRPAWHQRWPWMPWAVAGLALSFGWFTNELGTERTINVLSFPLLLLILWNLSVAVLSLWAEYRSRYGSIPALPRPGAGPYLDELATTGAARISAWEKPQQLARGAMVFHVTAIALAVGIVSGMYTRALVKNYSVGMDSTFLSEPQVMAVSRAVLGPASIVTGIPVPGPGGSAAPWIHLWAASALLFIIVPRLILINMARTAMRRPVRGGKSLVSAWAKRGRALSGGASILAEVLPVHHEAPESIRDALGAVLAHHWGAGTIAHFLPPVIYGQEAMAAEHLPHIAGHFVLLFSFAATPEAAIHGKFIKAIAGRSKESQMLLLLDATGYEQRFGTLPEYPRMVQERTLAWQTASAGLIPIIVLDEKTRRSPGTCGILKS